MVEAPDLTPRLGEKRDNGLWVISHNEKGYQATWKSVN